MTRKEIKTKAKELLKQMSQIDKELKKVQKACLHLKVKMSNIPPSNYGEDNAWYTIRKDCTDCGESWCEDFLI